MKSEHRLELKMISLQSMISEMDILGGIPHEITEYSGTLVSVNIHQPLAVGLLVSMNIQAVVKGRPQVFPAAGKIVHVEPVESGGYRIRIQMRQFDNDIWNRLLQQLGHSQTRVDHLFAKIKGEP